MLLCIHILVDITLYESFLLQLFWTFSQLEYYLKGSVVIDIVQSFSCFSIKYYVWSLCDKSLAWTYVIPIVIIFSKQGFKVLSPQSYSQTLATKKSQNQQFTMSFVDSEFFSLPMLVWIPNEFVEKTYLFSMSYSQINIQIMTPKPTDFVLDLT